jgi:uncharacterized protein involved in exopolysaccharide biosynthesis
MTDPAVAARKRSARWRQIVMMLACFALGVAAAGLWSSRFLPVRYQARAELEIVPVRVPFDGLAPATVPAMADRLPHLSRVLLSRSRVEPLIEEFRLYESLRDLESPAEIVSRFRRDLVLDVIRKGGASNDIAGLTVRFTSSDPQTAVRVTDRMATVLVRENLLDAELLSSVGVKFIKGRIEELRRDVNLSERIFAKQRREGGSPGRAELIEYEVQQETLRALLVRQQELELSNNMHRRQIGEQIRVVDGAKLPTRPIGPDRLAVSVAGGFVGLAIGLVLLRVGALRQRRRSAPPE